MIFFLYYGGLIMFNRKIEVSCILQEVYTKANKFAEYVLNESREDMILNAKEALLFNTPVSDDFLCGKLDGIDSLLDVLTDLLDEKTMLDKEEKHFIEEVEENIKQALIKLEKRNPGKVLGHEES